MRVFLDECVDWRLSREITGHEVFTAQQMQWAGLKNGDLLARVSRSFDVFVTVDRNLAFQQNLENYDLAVVILRAKSNRLGDVRALVPALLRLLSQPLARRAHTIDSTSAG
jgi:hypothetical protein